MIPSRFVSLQLQRLMALILLSASIGTCLGGQFGDAVKRAALSAKVKRVIFLGDSITYAGGYVGLVEAYFVTRYPGRTIEFINVGLPSETVSGLWRKGMLGDSFQDQICTSDWGGCLTKPS